MDRHHARSGRNGKAGGDQKEYRRNALRMERASGKWRPCLFPHPRPDGLHRIRSAAVGWRSDQPHSHDLPRPDERVWGQMVEAVTMMLRHLPLVFVAMGAAVPVVDAHVLDEYLQSTLVAIEPGDIRLKINLTPGVEIADKVLA